MFESLEGKRGEPRNKPPYPTTSGLFGKPTCINNVETLVHTVMILKYGAAHFKELGTKDSRGSKVFSVSGDTPKAGIFEEAPQVFAFPGRNLMKPSLVLRAFPQGDP